MDINAKLQKLLNVDRRVIYVVLFVAISIPFFITSETKVRISPSVRAAYDVMEEAGRTGKPVIISFDYDPSVLAELQPMAKAFLRHAFARNLKVLGMNFVPNGTSLGANTMDIVAKEFNKKYGEDYVYMGYFPQPSIAIQNFGDNLRSVYKKDYNGTEIDNIPFLKNITNYDDFHALVEISGTKMTNIFIQYGVARYKFNMIGAVTAVSANEYYPYLQSQQLKGLLPGMKAAAEYEFLIKENGLYPSLGDGMRGMNSQSWGHIAIIIFIIIGNIAFLVNKRKQKMEAK